MIPIKYSVRSMMLRSATSIVTASVIALVAMIAFILFGFVDALRAAVLRSAAPQNWVLISRGAPNEAASFISRDQYEILESNPHLATGDDGRTLVSPEIVTAFRPAQDFGGGAEFITLLRGIQPAAYVVHNIMRIEAGRWPNRGAEEISVGRSLAAKFPELSIGKYLSFGRLSLKIVGIYSDQESARESEAVTDLNVITQEIRMNGGFNVLHVVVRPNQEAEFVSALTKDARLKVDALPEKQFYEEQTEFVTKVRNAGLVVVGILALGSIFGATNTMFSAIARRTPEIGVFRTLGFSRSDVLISFVGESLLLALLGGLLGEMLGVLLIFGTSLHKHLMNLGSFMFRFRLSPIAFLAGLAIAIVIGILGGALPAWRASRLAITKSLRAV
jgi:putative ABC transport system permease protein